MKIYTAEELSNEQYHADKTCLSSSMIKDLYNKGSYEFYQLYIARTKEKKFYNMDALNMGSLMHSLLFEPDTVGDLYTTEKDIKNKTFIPDMNWITAHNLVKTLIEHPEVVNIMKSGVPEQSIMGKLLNVGYKVRFDWSDSKRHIIADLKTTSKEKLDKAGVIESVIGDLAYDISAASYMDMYAKVYGNVPDFYFIFVSTKDFSIEVGRVTPQMLEEGRKKYKHALKRYKKLLKSGDWAIRDLYLPEKYCHRG